MTELRGDVVAPEVMLEYDKRIRIRDVLVVLDGREVIKHILVTDPGYEGDTGGEDQEGDMHHCVRVLFLFVPHLVSQPCLFGSDFNYSRIPILHKISHWRIIFASAREFED